MAINNRLTQIRQQRIKRHIHKSNPYSFFNLLTGPDLLSKIEGLLPEHRERLFPPTETLSMFLAQAMNADRSCQNAVNDISVKRVMAGLSPNSTRTGGYCKARQRLPTQMISTLTRQVSELMEKETPNQWHWQGRRVCLVDGTTVSMPDTPKNQAAYPQHKGIKTGLGFPICRLVGIISLSTGAVLNVIKGVGDNCASFAFREY